MSELGLARLISDKMVLQQKKEACIWGTDSPGRKVKVTFLAEEYVGVTDENGKWKVRTNCLEAGGPHAMLVEDDAGNEKVIADILIGDVWVCAGQSNMELPMERVEETYVENPQIRTFKVLEHADFHGPVEDHLSGEWKAVGKDTILQFSATAYFFAEQYYRLTGVPVGLINASLGGSRIESWMDREMLCGYEEMLKTAEQYKDDEFVKGQLNRNQKISESWHQSLDSRDAGLTEGWYQCDSSLENGEQVSIPFFFRDTKLKDFIGSVWFRKNFWIPPQMAGKSARLLLGTIVDSDMVWINGTFAGQTEYQYPPRRYQVQEGILKEGSNTIVIRVKCENGNGRFTPDKQYSLSNEGGEIDLSGSWLYRKGAEADKIQPTDFVNWKPTGLYYGMMAPCISYVIAGFLWYQGESNTHEPFSYCDLMTRMIQGYRSRWKDDKLPFLYVQLPNFAVDVYDSDGDETGEGWPVVREQQRRALANPETGMVVAIDLGEDNDLHPLNKREVGRRLAFHAAKKLNGYDVSCEGPQVTGIEEKTGKDRGVVLTFKHTGGVLYAGERQKGSEITDFELQEESGCWYPAIAQLNQNQIILTCRELEGRISGVRYCYRNTNRGALIYNKEGFPMSPFLETLVALPTDKEKKSRREHR